MSKELVINREFEVYEELGWPHDLLELRNMNPKALARYLRGKAYCHEKQSQEYIPRHKKADKYGITPKMAADDIKFYHAVNQLYNHERPIILHRRSIVSLWALREFVKLECEERQDTLLKLLINGRAEGRSNLTTLIKGKRTGVYFIQPVCGGPIKIGWSHDYEERLVSLQAFSPLILRVIGFCKSGRCQEQMLHHWFSEFRLHGEWFEPHPIILDYIHKNPWEVEVLA